MRDGRFKRMVHKTVFEINCSSFCAEQYLETKNCRKSLPTFTGLFFSQSLQINKMLLLGKSFCSSSKASAKSGHDILKT